MTPLEQNSAEIDRCEDLFKKAECRFDALAELKKLDTLYDEKIKLLKEGDEDSYGIYQSYASGKSSSLKMVIALFEKI